WFLKGLLQNMTLILFVMVGVLIVSLGLNALAVWRGWLFVRERSSEGTRGVSAREEPVTLLIPVCGVEGEGVAHFRRFCELDWPEYQVVFTVLDARDAALPLLGQLRSNERCSVEIQVGGEATGVNLKIRNLLNARPRAKHEWIVICDADVRPDADL